MVTASTLSGDREICLSAGTDDFIPKPVSLDELSAKLNHWIHDRPRSDDRTMGSVGSGAGPAVTRESVEQALEALRRDLGDAAASDAVMHTFVGQIPIWRRGAADGDADSTRLVGHTVKTAARILGLHRLAATAEEVELAEDESVAPGSVLVERLLRELEIAETTMATLNSEPPPTD